MKKSEVRSQGSEPEPVKLTARDCRILRTLSGKAAVDYVNRKAARTGTVAKLPRVPGKTYVFFREGHPWHACHVTILPHSSSFKIGGEEYFDCYLPTPWKKIATAKQDETLPLKRSELW